MWFIVHISGLLAVVAVTWKWKGETVHNIWVRIWFAMSIKSQDAINFHQRVNSRWLDKYLRRMASYFEMFLHSLRWLRAWNSIAEETLLGSRFKSTFFPCQVSYHSNKNLNEFHNWVIWSETPMMYSVCGHPPESSATLPKFISETLCNTQTLHSRALQNPMLSTTSLLASKPSYSISIPLSNPPNFTHPQKFCERRTNPPFGSARSRGPHSRY
jgi:hypothetical protein